MSDSKNNEKERDNSWCDKCDVQTEDGLVVCVRCGKLYNKNVQQLADDPTQGLTLNCRDDEVKSYVAHSRHFPNRFPVGKRQNTDDIDRLVSNLSLEADVKNDAILKFKVMIDGHFRNYSRHNKRILAGICVYTSLINEKSWVTIGHICNTVGCVNSDFCKIYNQVIKEYPQYRCDKPCIEDLIAVTLSETKIDEEEKKVICNKIVEILELERDCWMIEGRTPVHIIFAASYLAWKSVKPYDRRKVNLTEYCRKTGIEYKHTTSQRVTELLNAIITLANNQMLSPKKKITKNNIGIFLDQILEYRSSLVYDFNQKIKQRNGLQTYETNSDGTPNMFSVFKRKFKESEESNAQTTGHSVTGDEEIDDKEIDLYLRDPTEVKYIKKLKSLARFQNEDEDNSDDND